ncbi:MAG TPA: hypothetical protein P5120_00155 [Spirochaetota bacterium]|nr:hypothetical protein [Spirochaetota bacterium]HPF05883.1 hypothetical protein [Spirochaetota bacterium]HPJ40722.1 hypothetical protein [Spirochaetota bacterium]HPR35991.1 hypothetical protein [Spirochaetota bacterium]HRX45905.1 hypothetical protein [Spirochaetota bacterium]
MEDTKKFIFVVLLLLLSGVFTGWGYGTLIVNRLMRGEIGLSAFIFTPSKNLFDTYILLNSENELKRLEGYYSYRATGLRDFDFLFKRYELEKSDIIKKTIIWIADEETSEEKIYFFKKLYDISTGSLKIYLQRKIESFELIHNTKIQPQGE